ncbi:molybdopterin converting factor subunit 1 [Muricoccus vinaceus]|uniref:Molybdopterin synthase sulfur carrier subunit n=1 Tax=Muricoccus vinaceus TaxID=424704 RepID=A0ABV6IMY1_9PROT
MKILYFAWLRQRTGTGEENLSPPPEVTDVGGLMRWLSARSPGHAQAFADPAQVRCAVNQDFCGPDHPVSSGDEVAFFPPVTGG